jgi:hypothetical protein
MADILLIFRDRDFAITIKQCIEEAQPTAIVDIEHTCADARRRLRGNQTPYSAVVCQIDAPESPSTASSDDAGIALLASLPKYRHGAARPILYSYSLAPISRSATENIHHCVCVTDIEHLVSEASATLQRDGDQEKLLNVVFSLDLAKGIWSYELKGKNFQFDYADSLIIDGSTLSRLIELSEIVGNLEKWELSLRSIGGALLELFFKRNGNFAWLFAEGVGQAGGFERTSICFRIERSVHPIMLEALVTPVENEFWMLKAPLYRKLQHVLATRYPLYSPNSPAPLEINCLVIESEAEGSAPALARSFSRLAYVAEECNWVQDFLLKNRTRLALGSVLKVSPALVRAHNEQTQQKRSFKDFVKDLLRGDLKQEFGDEWHLIHYAGHSYYDDKRNVAYLLFPGDDYIEAVDSALFSAWLGSACFVYLSSCTSYATEFVFELAKNRVPAVMGFRWELEDQSAFQFAKEFYSELSKHSQHSLERAYLRARQNLHEKDQSDKTWAAPILVLQG